MRSTFLAVVVLATTSKCFQFGNLYANENVASRIGYLENKGFEAFKLEKYKGEDVSVTYASFNTYLTCNFFRDDKGRDEIGQGAGLKGKGQVAVPYKLDAPSRSAHCWNNTDLSPERVIGVAKHEGKWVAKLTLPGKQCDGIPKDGDVAPLKCCQSFTVGNVDDWEFEYPDKTWCRWYLGNECRDNPVDPRTAPTSVFSAICGVEG